MNEAKIYYNAEIHTMQDHAVFDSMRVENGRIAAIGSHLERKADTATLVDMKGRAILPAFLDAHSHITSVGFSFLQTDLTDCRSIAQIGDRLADAGSEGIPFVQACGYDHNDLIEKRHPTRAELDLALPDTPCVIVHRSGHFGVFNSSAIELLGLSSESGYLEEGAFVAAQKRIPLPTLPRILDGFEKAQRLYASHGVTCVQDGMIVREMLPVYRALLAEDRIFLNVYGLAAIQDRAAVCEQLDGRHPNVEIVGYKIILDGSPQGKTAWMLTPYLGTDGYCGAPQRSDDALAEDFRIALTDRKRLYAHCNGDAAAEQFLRVAQQFDADKIREDRPVIVHAQLIRPQQLARAAELGMIPSFFVAHVLHYGDVHIQNFGEARAEKISPAESARRLGMTFTFHQDSPVIPPNMFETIACAVTRSTKSGRILGASERLDRYEAVSALTRHAAVQYGKESERGTLAPGKVADFIVTDRNVFTVAEEEIADIRVLQTYKDGVCIYEI